MITLNLNNVPAAIRPDSITTKGQLLTYEAGLHILEAQASPNAWVFSSSISGTPIIEIRSDEAGAVYIDGPGTSDEQDVLITSTPIENSSAYDIGAYALGILSAIPRTAKISRLAFCNRWSIQERINGYEMAKTNAMVNTAISHIDNMTQEQDGVDLESQLIKDVIETAKAFDLITSERGVEILTAPIRPDEKLPSTR